MGQGFQMNHFGEFSECHKCHNISKSTSQRTVNFMTLDSLVDSNSSNVGSDQWTFERSGRGQWSNDKVIVNGQAAPLGGKLMAR